MRRKFRYVEKGADRYVVGKIEQYDQRNEAYKRMLWDPKLLKVGKKFYRDPVYPKNKPGYRLEDFSMVNASWHVEDNFGRGIWGGKEDLYSWDWEGKYSYPRVPPGLKIGLDNPQEITHSIKKAAAFFGADKVGVCKLDRRWLYSRGYTITADGGKSFEIDLPEEYTHAVVFAIEMDYEAIACSPEGPSTSATGLGYSKMAFVAGMLATYIRGLGYKAVPCGNDTACSIPLAIDAGLGELGRNTMLFTPEFGPRVRLAKVFTDLPLVVDKPIEFGVWEFCKTCKKCAESCPSQALSHGDPTEEIHDICNREGIRIWHIDASKCAAFWTSNILDCANCLRACPFNKKSGFLHDLAKWKIRRTRMFNRTLVRLDDWLGYGQKKDSSKFWSAI
jgi:epoxyqueuosine reductase